MDGNASRIQSTLFWLQIRLVPSVNLGRIVYRFLPMFVFVTQQTKKTYLKASRFKGKDDGNT